MQLRSPKDLIEDLIQEQLDRQTQDPHTIMADMAVAVLLLIARSPNPARCRKAILDRFDDPEEIDLLDRRCVEEAFELIEKGRDLPPGQSRVECLANDMDLPPEELIKSVCRVAIYDAILIESVAAIQNIRRSADIGAELRQLDKTRPMDDPPIVG